MIGPTNNHRQQASTTDASNQTPRLTSRLSSTTPDLPASEPLLAPAATLATGAGLGVLLGALALRSRGAGWSLPALASGAWKGALVGAGMGASLVGLDHLTGGQVKRQLDYISLDHRAQIAFVLKNVRHPWVASTGIRVASDARAAQVHHYGSHEPLDGPQDAFRHAFAAALFTLRAMRDHGADPVTAARLAIGAGAAHEADGQDNNDDYSRAMDHANNEAGAALAGDGRPEAGEGADARGFLTEAALAARVLDAMRAGSLQLVDRSSTPPTSRKSTEGDLPHAVHGPDSNAPSN